MPRIVHDLQQLTPEEAERYWRILPPAQAENVVTGCVKFVENHNGIGSYFFQPQIVPQVPQTQRATKLNRDKWNIVSLHLSIERGLLVHATPAFAVELFRYRGAAKDGGTLEYVFDTDEPDVQKRVTEKKAAEIAADFMTSYYGIQVGALETQEFRTTPIPFWLVCFSDTVKGPMHQLFFVVVVPDGTLVEPSVGRRL